MDEDLTFFAKTCSRRNGIPIVLHNTTALAEDRRAIIEVCSDSGELLSTILYKPASTAVTVQKIFRLYGKKYLKKSGNAYISPYGKVVYNIIHCRTPAMGTHTEMCDTCGSQIEIANSCGRNYCNLCAGSATAKWTRKRQQEVLNIKYHHAVFTVPDCLNEYFLQKPGEMYNILFKAVSDTIKKFSRDEKHLGANPGFICVLHTWGQNLSLHPHVHVILTAGGLSKDKTQWVEPKSNTEDFLFPVRALAAVFRGKFMQSFRELFKETDLCTVRHQCYKKPWVVFSKPTPGSTPEITINYLARYAFRPAISNSRLLSCDDGKVVFRYHDYRTETDGEMTLDAEEFMRRYLMHVLPPHFRRIRYCGFLSTATRKKMLPLIRVITNTAEPKPLPETAQEIVREIASRESTSCPYCEIGHLIPQGILAKARQPDADSKGGSEPDEDVKTPEAAIVHAAGILTEGTASLPHGPPVQNNLIA